MKKMSMLVTAVFLALVMVALALPSAAMAASYDLWVGGVRVNDSNKGNILGNGTAKYDPATKTLTFSGLTELPGTYTVDDFYHYGVFASDDLKVAGTAVFEISVSGAVSYGIYSAKSLTLLTGADLSIKADHDPFKGQKSLIIEGGTLDVYSVNGSGLASPHIITVNGGNVFARGHSFGIDAQGADFTINDGSVVVESFGSGYNGIRLLSSGRLRVNGGVLDVTAKSSVFDYSSEVKYASTHAITEGGLKSSHVRIAPKGTTAYSLTNFAVNAKEIGEYGGKYYVRGDKYALTWRNNSAPPASYYECITGSLYNNRNLTDPLTEEPKRGKTYYCRSLVEDNSPANVDLSFALSAAKCELNIPGYTAQCVGVSVKTNAAGDRYFHIVFGVTKDADHVMTSCSLSATELKQDSDNYYFLSGWSGSFRWKDNRVPSASKYTTTSSNLYTNPACTNYLTTEPQVGTPCYVAVSVWNQKAYDHSIDFSRLERLACKLSVAGYTVYCKSISTDVYNNKDRAKIVFELTKNPYVLTSLSSSATGIGQDSDGRYLLNDWSGSFRWKDNRVPAASKYSAEASNLYANSACTSLLTAEPQGGKPCYVKVYVRNKTAYDHSIDFSRLEKSACNLFITGYNVSCESAVKIVSDNQDAVAIVFEMVKFDSAIKPYVLTGMAISATGVKSAGSGEPYKLDGRTQNLTWKEAKTDQWTLTCADIYTDEACTVPLKNEPKPGGLYYVPAIFRNNTANNHDIIFDELAKTAISLTVPGFTTTVLNNNKYVDDAGRDTLKVVFGMTADPHVCPSAKFTDVNKNPEHWTHAGIDYVVKTGLMNGTGPTTFSPNATTTRAMIVTILYRVAGEPSVSGSHTFKDVPDGKWYSKAVLWANQKGVVTGHDAYTFDPMGEITREQFAAMLFRYFTDYLAADTSARANLGAFSDGGKVSGYAVEAVGWAVAKGYLKGDGGKLDPRGNATRAQIATVLKRCFE